MCVCVFSALLLPFAANGNWQMLSTPASYCQPTHSVLSSLMTYFVFCKIKNSVGMYFKCKILLCILNTDFNLKFSTALAASLPVLLLVLLLSYRLRA